MINYFFQNQPTTVIGTEHKQWILRCIESLRLSINEINYILVDDAYIQELNNNQLNHDYPTDILTFDHRDNKQEPILVDIYISTETVSSNAQIYGVAYEEELKRVMIHGILHLIGFDDHSEQDVAEMRNQENKLIKL